MVGGGWSDSRRVEQRQLIPREIRERYARFGDQLVQYLYEKSSQRGGLRRVLAQVLRPLPHDDERMHEALARFLSTEGVDAFFKRVEGNQGADTQDAGRPAGIIEMDRDIEGVTVVEVDEKDAQQSVEGYRPTLLSPTPAEAPPAPSQEPSTPPTETHPPPTPSPAAPRPTARTRRSTAEPWDGRERRSGREARLGIERRSGKERRTKVDMVFKNLRFGPPRRTGIERRSGRDRRAQPPSPNL